MAEASHPSSTGARFLILLVALIAVVTYAVIRLRTAPNAPREEEDLSSMPATAALPPWEQPDPPNSRNPDVTPEFDLQVELHREGPRNVLYFYITERHGFLADGILVEFWHQRLDPATGEWIQDGTKIGYQCRGRLDFGGSLVENTTLTELEMSEVGDVGTSENWQARVAACLRVKARAPAEQESRK
ncbi:MAG TPA: hypothetical protein VGM03_11315 [Phycisphaerae bacterium]